MKGNAWKEQNNSTGTSTPCKKSTKTVCKRLSKESVAQFIINNIRTEAELTSEAKKREQAGESDLWSFIITKPKRTLQELIKWTWTMHWAPESTARDKLSKMQKIQKQKKNELKVVPELGSNMLTKCWGKTILKPMCFAVCSKTSYYRATKKC